MSCLPALTRLNDLKRRFNELKNEADTAVSNIKSILDRGKSIVASQQSLNDAETFLRRFPAAGSEFDLLISNLVKINCELEIVLCKPSDFSVVLNEDLFGCEYRSCVSPVETRCASTNTEDVNVNSLIKYSQENICHAFDLEVGSILEMKFLLGDHPLDFWLCSYPSEEFISHIHNLSELLKFGKCQQMKTSPAIGQFVIGSVYRGCVLSVFGRRIVALDIDTGVIKFTNVDEVWIMEDDILNFPPQAINCRLSQIPKDIEWCDELKHIFRKCMENCNLVVTIMDVEPNIPPTFVVEIDGHDGTILDVNLNMWIESHVIPGLEKLKLLNFPETNLKSFYDDLDPYFVYQKEECEYDNDKSNPESASSVSIIDCSLHSDDSRKVNNSYHSIQGIGNDMSVFIPDSSDRSIPLSVSPNDTNNAEIIDTTSATNGEVTQSFIINELDPSYCVDDPVDSEDFDITSLPRDENAKSFVTNEFSPQFNIADPYVNKNFASSTNVKSTVVCCYLDKGTSKDMSFVQGGDPWNFVLSHISDEDIKQLKKQISGRGERGELKHFSTIPEVDDFAIGLCNGIYFRARICNSLHGTHDDYLVVDIDTSEVKVISVHEIFILEEEFAFLPARALNCALWNITRTPPYWNTELGDCFQNFLQKNVLKVTVKEVIPVKDYWKHIVQVRTSDVECDLSEWIMLHVIPKLNEISNLDNTLVDCFPIIEKLNPEHLYPKSKKQSNAFKQNVDLNGVKEQKNNEMSTSFKTEQKNSVSLYDHVLSNSMSSSWPSENKCSYLKKCVEESEVSLEILKESGVNKKLDDDYPTVVDSSSFYSLTNFRSICDLKIGEKYYAFLSHVRHPSEFYVHIVSNHNSIIDDLQAALRDFCSEESIIYKTKAEVKQLISVCCAVNFESQWCRARIIDWLDNSSTDVKVFLVDYGIYATVPFHSVQYLKSEFYKQPVLALKCKLAQISPPNNCSEWPDQTVQYFLSILDFNTVYCVVPTKFSEDETTSVFLSLKDNGNVESVNDCLVNEGLATSFASGDEEVKIENCHSIVYPPISTLDELSSDDDMFYEDDWFTKEDFYFEDTATSIYKAGDSLSIVVTEIVNAASFYAVINAQRRCWGRMCDTHEMLVEMSNKIKHAVLNRKIRIVRNYVIGAIVVACYSKDKVWYRARILSPVDDDNSVEVFFVDYGNTDIVKKDQVREITKAFSSLPFQAVMFFINGISPAFLPDEKSKNEAKMMLFPLLGKVGVRAEVVRTVNEDIYIDVYCEDINFGLQIKEALALKGYVHSSLGKGFIPG